MIIIIIGFIILVPTISIVIYLVIRSRRGYLSALYLKSFELFYEESIKKSKSKSVTLYNSFLQLTNCPVLNKLSNSQITQAVQILSNATDPKNIVRKIILTLNLKKALQAFKDTKFLQELVSAEKKQLKE